MLALALILDAALGEPDWLWRRAPHPAALMGRMIAWLEARLNRGGAGARRMGGALCVALLVAAWGAGAALIAAMPFGWVFEIIGAAILLAQNSLVAHVRAVAAGLRQGLPEARRAVARIVGRDPQALDATGVARAAIESAAENFADGVVAPAFWFLIGGLPGIAICKAVNTADSMIGHRTPRYADFGWAAARLDDLANWIPARLAGALICVAGAGRAGWAVMRRDAGLHRSPNAGWPEAAMAAALGVSLSGPRVYGGVIADEPLVNEDGRAPGADDIDAAVAVLWRGWAALLALAAFVDLVS